MNGLCAADIHARLGSAWPSVLARLGIADSYLQLRKVGPCPICGGRDRFFFDNRKGRGDYFCRQCGAGDGFTLLRRIYGWPFAEARRRVITAAGLTAAETGTEFALDGAVRASMEGIECGAQIARPSARVRTIARTSCPIVDCPDAILYLESRGLWPLPNSCVLRAHAGLDYWDGSLRIGRYPGLVAEVRDFEGELVTLHVTYLEAGRKITANQPRKLLSRLIGREGCAVRLTPACDTLGIAEGIETALAATMIDGLPVWSALNTALLARFQSPAGISRLIVYADRDEAGLLAAARLTGRLRGTAKIELRPPPAPAKDWAEVLAVGIGERRRSHESPSPNASQGGQWRMA
jgi:putative DNA primase/helicase